MRPAMPQNIAELKPKITVIGVGGGGGNALNNMITQKVEGAEFVVANTDAQLFPCQKRRGLSSSVSP